MASPTTARPLSTRPLDAVYRLVRAASRHHALHRPDDTLPVVDDTGASNCLPQMADSNVQRPLLHQPACLVQSVCLDGGGLPCPPQRVGRRGFDQRSVERPRCPLSVTDLFLDSPLVPLQLLIWAVQTAVTTLVCIVDYSSWENYSAEERNRMHSIYGPYLVLGEQTHFLCLLLVSAARLCSGYLYVVPTLSNYPPNAFSSSPCSFSLYQQSLFSLIVVLWLLKLLHCCVPPSFP